MSDKYIIECAGQTIRLPDTVDPAHVRAAAEDLAEQNQQPATVYQAILIVRVAAGEPQ